LRSNSELDLHKKITVCDIRTKLSTDLMIVMVVIVITRCTCMSEGSTSFAVVCFTTP